MEAFRQWLQDWSDACEYANECAPDLSFIYPREPFPALAAIGLTCLGLWFWNERKIKKSKPIALSRLGTASELKDTEMSSSKEKLEELKQIIEQSRSLHITDLKDVA